MNFRLSYLIQVPLVVLLTVYIAGCGRLQYDQSESGMNALTDIQKEQAQSLSDQKQLLEQQSGQLTQLQTQLQLQSKQQSDQSQQLQALLTRAEKNVTTAVFTPPAQVSSSSCNVDGKLLLGSAEWVWLKPAGKNLRARIDTGAATSSLSTTNVEKFERDGRNWVRFQLVEEGQARIAIEARLLRTVKIRQASLAKGERRYVVRLPLQLGEFIESAEFTLADRANMRYPILLGREFLRDVALVDVSRKYVQAKSAPVAELGWLSTANLLQGSPSVGSLEHPAQ